jgi:signal peptidase I
MDARGGSNILFGFTNLAACAPAGIDVSDFEAHNETSFSSPMNETAASGVSPPLWMRLVFGRNPKVTLIRLSCTVVLILVLFRVILIPIRVSGLSMTPTFRDGKVTLVNHQAYRWKKPQRGDVVAFRLPEEGGVVLLKRIVGLPGERVRIVDGRVYINGQPLREPYARTGRSAQSSASEYSLGEDEYFVVGDNRFISVFGQIPEHYIIGKVLF